MTTYHRAEDVSTELKTRLATLTVAQGAETDLGRVVYLGKRVPDKSMVPCAVLLEGDDDPERQGNTTTYKVTRRFILMAYVTCDPDNPNVAAHAALRDMKRAVFGDGGRMGDKVRTVTYVGTAIGPRADGENFVLALLEVDVEYVESLSSP